VVDEERVTRLLAGIRADVASLRQLAADIDPEAPAPVSLDAVKYRFVTAIEGCTRVAHHVVAAEGWHPPDSNAAALRELGEHDVLDAVTAESMAKATGFRNVLVHQYADVDDGAVLYNLALLGDVDAFVQQVARWLDDPLNRG
jgi:uncharacterized protein YutE (UPF0331/DUF86 family)